MFNFFQIIILLVIFSAVGEAGNLPIPGAFPEAPFEADLDTDFFTSDQHFDHPRILKLSGRPFASLADMQDAFIERWNKVVPEDARVWILGDFAGGQDAVKETLNKLKGRKILILGNHDLPHPNNKLVSNDKNRVKWFERYKKMDFEAVYLTAQLRVPGVGIVNLCHYPYSEKKSAPACGERMVRGQLYDDGNLLLCGHVHGQWATQENMINVGVDVNDFTPNTLRQTLRKGAAAGVPLLNGF